MTPGFPTWVLNSSLSLRKLWGLKGFKRNMTCSAGGGIFWSVQTEALTCSWI